MTILAHILSDNKSLRILNQSIALPIEDFINIINRVTKRILLQINQNSDMKYIYNEYDDLILLA